MPQELTIQTFQALIRDRYFKTDSERGVGGTFLWLSEEFGELAHALGKWQRGDGDMDNLEEEFADVIAWVTTLANITGVDLSEALHKKYIEDGGPTGEK